MDNSIQATSCKASAEISFGQRSTGPATGSSFRTHGDSTPRSTMGADRGEVVAGMEKGRAYRDAMSAGSPCA